MTAPVLLTGGTGTLGRRVVPLLLDSGAGLRVLSRTSRLPSSGIDFVTGDLLTGEGLAPALDGVDTVLHLAGGPKDDDRATQVLVRAASRAGVRHLVYISVIGADTVPLAWFRTKLAAEQAVAEAGIPWTTLRAAQFHDLVLTVAEKLARLPVVPSPGGFRLQPVDTGEVAERLVELTRAEPLGLVRDLAGPDVQRFDELVRGYLAARGRRRLFLPVHLPGRVARAYRAGDNVAVANVDRGRRSWADFLRERFAPARPALVRSL